MLSIMWLCALKNNGSNAKFRKSNRKRVVIDETICPDCLLPKAEMYSSDEAPMYKEPPPKYD